MSQVSFSGRNYKVVGNDEDILMFKCYLESTQTPDFKGRSFQASLTKLDEQATVNFVFSKNIYLNEKADTPELKFFPLSHPEMLETLVPRLGIGTESNLTKAVYWFEKSALQRNAKAQLDLALMYYNGESYDKDFLKTKE